MAAGLNKRRMIQHAVFQELCKVSVVNFQPPFCNGIRQPQGQERVAWYAGVYIVTVLLLAERKNS